MEEDNSWSRYKRTTLVVVAGVLLERFGLATAFWVSLKHQESLFSYFTWFGAQLQLFWSFWYDQCEGDQWCVGYWLPTLFPQAAFWTFNAFLLCLECFERPRFLLQYKTQPEVKISRRQLVKCVCLSTFNMTVLWLLSHWVTYNAMLRLWGADRFSRQLPGLFEFAYQATIITCVEEAGFYYFHRLFHTPLFYKRVHKIHHEFTAPIGLASVYAHPLEHLLANTLPVMAGPLLGGTHVAVLCLWYTEKKTTFAVALVQTTFSHCGYHFPFLPSNEQHDYHHLKLNRIWRRFNQNFGVMGWLDTLHGTNSQFQSAVQSKRHQVIASFTPAQLLIPDQTKHAGKQNNS